ncbi:MAG: tripartite tricarboxylate transporter TctB family protein [Acidobacteria bacterium]|nr:tripartite tricarboxylate transporter TctB family protein [Acidobacteriota bacterium]
MSFSLRARRSATLIAIGVLALAGCTSESAFPDGPILLVCPWAAGGGSDRVARQIATLLEQDLDVPVNVVNVTGGDGVTGHSRGALARPDGYTMTLITVEITTLHWRQMTSISPQDFTPLGLVNRDAAALFVRDDAPWKTARDLEQAVRAAPGRLRASGTATAGIWHLGLAGWLTSVGLRPADVIWVSIAGAAPSLTELLAGGIDIVACSLAEAQALLEAGRIRSLGVMAEERVARFPSVPTLAEQGVDFSLGTIRGIAVPNDVSPDRVRVLADALRRVVNSAEYQTSLSNAGFTPAYEDPVQFAATLRETDERLGDLLRSDAFAGLAVQQIGPTFFPALLFAALATVVIGLLVTSRFQRRETSAPDDGTPSPPGAAWRFVEPLLWIALYVLLAEWLGFLLTAGALLLVYLVRLGTRLRIAVPIALLIVPAAYYVFGVLLRVGLPRGMLGW